jgi:hypothetical protein
MHRIRVITAIISIAALTAALGVSGCGAAAMDTSGRPAQVTTPLDPANKARDAAGAANQAIKGLQSDVDSNTPGK